jgi:hypothetical protein
VEQKHPHAHPLLLPSLLLHSEKKDQERGREGEHAGYYGGGGGLEKGKIFGLKTEKMTKFSHCYTFL